MVEISGSVTVHRPLAEVQAQFGDVAYHQRNGHHRGVTFRVVEETASCCRYEQETRVGPFRLVQQFRLQRDAPHHQVNELLEGPFSPGSITFDVVAEGADAARVTATLRSTRSGPTRIAAALLRPALGRALETALEEDRIDLESGAYARNSSAP
ncbi:MAG: hypothetical protein ACKVWR_03455 [Acidimicrobiales bacterium]